MPAAAPLTWLTAQKPAGAESPWPGGTVPAVPACLVRAEGLTQEEPRLPTTNPRRSELEPRVACGAPVLQSRGCATHQAPRAGQRKRQKYTSFTWRSAEPGRWELGQGKGPPTPQLASRFLPPPASSSGS
ncbi:hypothetical protein KIL84_002341 [Mauremys mutica]|uniref:Uncharacterized protein n=1 Tax=Mauremys mutica TaxID=74926 RepID=A0A9D3X7D2_9SAUR|nr:hypothetical protein KIL84_002341 [Mauremys mutica]